MNNKSKSEITFGLTVILLVCLNIYGATFPDISNWGFNRWSVVPTSIAIPSLILLLIVALFVSVKYFLQVSDKRVVDGRVIDGSRSIRSNYKMALVPMLFLLYVLRSQGHVYGDGYLVLSELSELPTNLWLGNYKFEIGSVLLEKYVTVLFSSVFSLSSTSSFTLLTSIGGGIGFFAILGLCRRMTTTGNASLNFVVAISSGSVLLFFGHLEHYVWPLAIGLWSLNLSLDTLGGIRKASQAIFVGVIATFLHIMAAPFLGLAVLAGVWNRYLRLRYDFAQVTLFLAIVGSVSAVVVTGVSESLGIVGVFSPWFSSEINSYTILSWVHIRDVLNLIIFVAPLSVGLLFVVFKGKSSRDASIEKIRFLGLAGFLLFIPSFLVDPALGAVRDWDLLAMSGIPISLYAWNKIVGESVAKNSISIFLLAGIVVVTQLAPNLFEKTDSQRSAIYLDRMLWNDPHYQADYYVGKRCLSWGAILRTNVGRSDLAEKYFERRVRANENEFAAWNTLGEIAFERGDFDSAANSFARSLGNNPDQGPHYLRLTQALGLAERWSEALEVARAAVLMNPTDQRAEYNLGILLVKLGEHGEALRTFQKIDDSALYQTTDIEAYLGTGFSRILEWDSAYVYLKSFMDRHPNRMQIRESLLQAEIAIGRYEEALETIGILRGNGYSPTILNEYERSIRVRYKGRH